ncbi:TraB domain-containing protein [Candidatus Micrarchaeota archaeon]|nr:TraB domain-containing protein [Candidatus Micrarchaeota archaeon]
MKRIYLIPVAHISKISVKTVNESIIQISPQVVCVELCYSRFRGLMSNKKRLIPTLNPLHLILYYFQQMIGMAAKAEPGEEMKAAAVTAYNNKIKVALIDMPIQYIMKGLSNVPLSEWLTALFKKEKVEFEISKALEKGDVMYALSPEKIEMIIEKFRLVLPNVHKIMIEDRNIYMVKNIEKILENHDTIICVIGAGHLPGMWKLLKQTYKNNLMVDIIWPN